MKTAVVALALAASASAFVAPSSFAGTKLAVAPATSALKMSFEAEPGVNAPIGFFDPAGLVADGDVDKFNKYRLAEFKHGRIAMLAMLHMFVTHFFKLPGLESVGLPESVEFSFTPTSWPLLGVAQATIFASALELHELQAPSEPKVVGNLQPPTSAFPEVPDDADEAFKITSNELNNGRLAMIAFMGAATAGGLTGGADPIDTFLSKF